MAAVIEPRILTRPGGAGGAGVGLVAFIHECIQILVVLRSTVGLEILVRARFETRKNGKVPGIYFV